MNFIKNKKGFSLAEIVVVTGITAIIFVGVFNFASSIFLFNSDAQKNLNAQNSARRVLKNMVSELRSASFSSLGGYPVLLASSTAITFFVDLDNDDYKEQVRYYLQGNVLMRGVIKPSGDPLDYKQSDEQVTILIDDIVNDINTPIFSYYDSNYLGTTTPLSQPVQPTKVRLIRITLMIDKDPNRSSGSMFVTTQVFLRNLKDNL